MMTQLLTTFLTLQVEYAVEAINHAGAAVGIKTEAGVILATEKRVLSKVSSSDSKSTQLDPSKNSCWRTLLQRRYTE